MAKLDEVERRHALAQSMPQKRTNLPPNTVDRKRHN